ncbi:MAG: hypothetical protein H0X24_19685 [Ktedonobacterales bacterium]|nr:hypothetical protein [Ktedonobacterales bacterium]
MNEIGPTSLPEALEQIEQLQAAHREMQEQLVAALGTQKDLQDQNARLRAIVAAYQNAFTGIMPALDAFPKTRESIIKLKDAIERAT